MVVRRCRPPRPRHRSRRPNPAQDRRSISPLVARLVSLRPGGPRRGFVMWLLRAICCAYIALLAVPVAAARADTQPPETTVTSSPPSVAQSQTAQFSFSSSEPGTFQCRLDGGIWAGCSSPKSYSSLSIRRHTFEVRAVDGAGNSDATPARRVWDIVLANSHSETPAVSADGRYIAFASEASNLVGGDTNGASDIFVRDQTAGTTRRVSVSSSREQANGRSSYPSISDDGRYVAFESDAWNLVASDGNGVTDVFVADLATGEVRRVSVDWNGGQLECWEGSGGSGIDPYPCGYPAGIDPSISGDGQYVAFVSRIQLGAGTSNGRSDVYVHDRSTGVTVDRITVPYNSSLTGGGVNPSISRDGRYVAFESAHNDIVGSDTNSARDVFVRDRSSNTTNRVSLANDGQEARSPSAEPAISGDGRFVAFESWANNLITTDAGGAPDSDTNNAVDVFRRDRSTPATIRVSGPSAQKEPDGGSSRPTITADGQRVAFESDSTNQTANPTDINGVRDIYEWPAPVDPLRRLSQDDERGVANAASSEASISDDGLHTAFVSAATTFGATAIGTRNVLSHRFRGAACFVTAVSLGVLLSEATDDEDGESRQYRMRVQLQTGGHTIERSFRNEHQPITKAQVRQMLGELYAKVHARPDTDYPFTRGQSQLVTAVVKLSERIGTVQGPICQVLTPFMQEVWEVSGRQYRIDVDTLGGCNLWT